MTFDREVLIRNFPRARVPVSRAPSFAQLLNYIELDAWTMLRQIAYFLATVQWETAGTFDPIRERRASTRQPALRKLQDRYWQTGYYGRGYIQLTWKRNYAKAGRLINPEDPNVFVRTPDLLLIPHPSYTVAAEGMRIGLFTSKKLDDYIKEGIPPDYFNARRIVNVLDHAADIAALANAWELILRAAKE